ncbi:2-succinyl-6-hydroxy-2,4-cyclohexadiene-1-carboxylate synthase [Limnofasciculus baicalensis]|uniref:Putative 2-succinyl-6-hydroxy-2,4-cyclohexadiene-1-carboxylate synthase n=1 Tax=Limnofasciculus baicalensis BBK-W-15 TaxID=2699891 RepID=A0AAE3GWP6_9CYAN|nr:2-succinyl-6-hydroxy-2,4-cyclohexadiene-1-carboxylate synthase [Limnofasciculus baicalensis]MCP2731869.1 2-succinyl-6-hydroxy-2,4-cyclohexadiene-1-carboxylate synthase [Limnofasciculus baicalensis BBK-W-15]
MKGYREIVKVDNYQFHYSLIGKLRSPIILFLHGFLGDCHEFDRVIALLAKDFCCLTVDLPGHGKTIVTGGNEYYTMGNTALGLIQFLNILNIDKCFLVGYSMGGRLALYLTIIFPHRFNKVVLESASPGLKTQEEKLLRIARDTQLAEELEATDFRRFLNNWYEQAIFSSLKEHRDFDIILERRLNNKPSELAKSLRNLSTGIQPSLWEKIQYNQIPLLLFVGEYDDQFKLINQEMAAISKGAELKLIKNSGHNIHWENVIDFTGEIGKFYGS